MSLMVLRIVIGIEGIVFAIVLMCVAAALASGLARRFPDRVSGIVALTTAVYILVLIWSVAVHHLGMPNPVLRTTPFALGLVIGNLIYILAARGRASA